MRTILLSTAVAACCLTSAAASAQSSADIVNALKPTHDMLSGATRGIRPIESTPEGSPRPASTPQSPRVRTATTGAAVHPRAANQAAPERAIDLIIPFRTGSADLTPQAARKLDQLGVALSSAELAAYRFRIEGHTDTVGQRDANQTLSERRARTVADYLEEKFGISQSRLEPVGMGQDHPAVPTGDQVPEERNRRVQVVNIGA